MQMQDILSRTATFLLAGGRGERLSPLTRHRSKPAVPFGDRRIIDFTLANCLKSGLINPFVIPQYQAAHLTLHVRRWWVEQSTVVANPAAAPVCVPAPQNNYLGTADALLRNLHSLAEGTRYVLVLSADHIYDMDYRTLLEFHAGCEAEGTLAAIVYPREASRQFGILESDGSGRIVGFEEKPLTPRELPGQPGSVLANMGIYVFNREFLQDALRRDAADPASAHDIGKNILPELVKTAKLSAFRFENSGDGTPAYWKDVGTIVSYYEASMDWLRSLPVTHRLAGRGSVIADGVRIHPFARVSDSILMSGVEVGPGAQVCRAILDENVRVMPGAQIGSEVPGEITVIAANSVVEAALPAGPGTETEQGAARLYRRRRLPAVGGSVPDVHVHSRMSAVAL